MLDGLDDIKWAELTHAYGSADGIQNLIRNLLLYDEQLLEDSYQALFSTIIHQDTVYEATAYAVPFLIELAETETVLMRHQILSLLSSIADIDVHDTGLVRELRLPRIAEMPTRFDKEHIHSRTAHEAVRKGIPTYLRLLEDPDTTIQAYSAEVLSRFPQDGNLIIPIMRAAANNRTKPNLKAIFIAHVGMLIAHHRLRLSLSERDACLKFFDELLDTQNPQTVRWSAAIACALYYKIDTPSEAVEILIDASINADPYTISDQNSTFRWPIPPLTALNEVGMAIGVPAIGRILAGSQNRDVVSRCGRRLLELLFKGDFYAYPPLSLSSTQYQALTAVLENDVFWETPNNLPRVNVGYEKRNVFGLLPERDAFRAFMRDVVVSENEGKD